MPDDFVLMGDQQRNARDKSLKKTTGKTSGEILEGMVEEGQADELELAGYEAQVAPESDSLRKARRTYAGQYQRKLRRRNQPPHPE